MLDTHFSFARTRGLGGRDRRALARGSSRLLAAGRGGRWIRGGRPSHPLRRRVPLGQVRRRHSQPPNREAEAREPERVWVLLALPFPGSPGESRGGCLGGCADLLRRVVAVRTPRTGSRLKLAKLSGALRSCFESCPFSGSLGTGRRGRSLGYCTR